jgi:hypothetical protein
MYGGSVMPITWTTNDLNMPIGVKFVGTDYVGSTIVSWAGPYSSANGGAYVKVPPAPSIFAQYNIMYLGIFPNTPNKNATTDGNIHTTGMIFSASTFTKPLGVVSPTLNSKVTIRNPGTVSTYLQVAEVAVLNVKNENIIRNKFNTYNSLVSSASYVYNGDTTAFGPQKAFDGNPSTFFYGGSNATTIDYNAFMNFTMSSVTNNYASTMFISTIEIQGSGALALTGMQVRYETANLPPAFPVGVFYSTMTITSSNGQVFNLA